MNLGLEVAVMRSSPVGDDVFKKEMWHSPSFAQQGGAVCSAAGVVSHPSLPLLTFATVVFLLEFRNRRLLSDTALANIFCSSGFNMQIVEQSQWSISGSLILEIAP